VLRECDERGIAFVPFSPLGWPRGQHNAILTNSVVTTVARHHGATAGQVVLAWLLAVVLLIPGTSRRTHLRENLGAGALSLEPDEIVRLTQRFQ
jgi:pyridoxine 4-dehydrogenase